MNAWSTFKQASRVTAVGGSVVVALGATTAAAPAQDDATADVVVMSRVAAVDNEQADRIEIAVHNGEINVVLNGEPVPAERIQDEDGRIVILDEDGNVLRSVGMALHEGHDFSFGLDDDGHQAIVRLREAIGRWHHDDADLEEASEPPVMLGIYMVEPDEALRYHLGLEEKTSVMVMGLFEDLPAHAAGLREFDIITEFDGDRTVTLEGIRNKLNEREPGDVISVSVIQAGQQRRVSVELEAQDSARMAEAALVGSMAGSGGNDFFQWRPGGPGEIRIEMDADADLRGFLVDPDLRIFTTPGGDADEAHRFFRRTLGGEPKADEARVGDLDERVRELEEALERALKEAERRSGDR